MKRHDKTIRYQPHATRRMRARGVSVEQVKQAIWQHDQLRPARREKATRFEKLLSRRKRLAVIAEETKREIWVITAFWM